MTTPLEAAIAQLNSEDPDRQQQAWALVYELLNPALRRAWSAWGDLTYDEGADVVGETWKRVWRASLKGQLPTEATAFHKYAVTTCQNLLRDGYRRSSRETVSIEDAEQSGALQEILTESLDDPDGESVITSAEIAALRRAVLERLPPADAELYKLYVSGRSPTEIASALGITRNTTDARISRLRKRLRAMAEAMRLYRHIVGW